MAAPAGLPDPDTLNVFAYYDPNLDEMVHIVSDDDSHPRIIDDYVIDPYDWQANNRGRNRGVESGPPQGVNTVNGVLTFDTDEDVCFVCDEPGVSCNGLVCIDIARDQFQHVADTKLQLRQAQWGYGVFALEAIPSGTLVAEYVGRLMPLDYQYEFSHRYTYYLEDHADCDSSEYGDISRYINHHCRPNAEVEDIMYGKRFALAFRTNRDIAAGEEIFIDYGADYFHGGFPCRCPAFPYPHTSQKYRRRVHPDGRVSPMGYGTFGIYDGKKGGRRVKKVMPAPVLPAPAAPAPVVPAPIKKGKNKGGKVVKAAAQRPRPRRWDFDAGAPRPKQQKRRRRLSWGSRSYRP